MLLYLSAMSDFKTVFKKYKDILLISFRKIPIGPGFAAKGLTLACIAVLIYIRIKTMYWYNGTNSYKQIRIFFVPVIIGLVMFLLAQFTASFPYHISQTISGFVTLFSFSIIIPFSVIVALPSMKFKLILKVEELFSMFV